MPIYEYLCKACGERFEVKQKISDPPITSCIVSSCSKGGPVEKLISPPAIMFKGTGWYVTDYSDKLKEPKKADSDGKSGEGKTESSTATKAEAKGGNGSSSSSESKAASPSPASSSSSSASESSSSKTS